MMELYRSKQYEYCYTCSLLLNSFFERSAHEEEVLTDFSPKNVLDCNDCLHLLKPVPDARSMQDCQDTSVLLDRKKRERAKWGGTEGLKGKRWTEMPQGRAGKNKPREQMNSTRFEMCTHYPPTHTHKHTSTQARTRTSHTRRLCDCRCACLV